MALHRKRLKRVAWGLGICMAAGLFGAVALVGWLRTSSGQALLQTRLEQLVSEQLPEGRLEVAGLKTNILSQASLHGVALVDEQGRTLVAIETLNVKYKVLPLLWSEVELPLVGVEGLVVDLRQDAQGVWDFQKMLPESEAGGDSVDWSVALGSVEVSGHSVSVVSGETGVRIGPHVLALSGSYHQGVVQLDLQKLDVEVAEPELGRVILSARGNLESDSAEVETLELGALGATLTLSASVEGLAGKPTASLALQSIALDLEPFGEWLGLEEKLQGEVTGTFQVDGGAEELEIRGRVMPQSGSAEVVARIESIAELPVWEVAVDLSEVNPAQHFPSLEPSLLSGRVTASGRGWTPGPQTRLGVSLEPGLFLGIELDEAELVAEFEEDGIQISRLDFDIAEGRIGFDGVFSEERLRGEISLDVPELSKLDWLGLTGVRGEATASGLLDWGVSDGRVRFEGEVDGERLELAESVVMVGAEGPIEFTVEDGRFRGSGRTRARGLQVDDVRLGEAAVEWSGVFSGDAYDVEGVLKAGGLEAAGLRVGALAGRFHASASSPLEVDASLQLRETSWQRFRAEEGLLTLRILEEQIMEVGLDLEHEGEPVLELTGQAFLESRQLEVERLVLAPSGYERWALTSPGSLTWHEDGVTDVDLELSSGSGRVALEGDGRLNGAIDAVFEVDELEVGWLNSLVEMPGWSGELGARLSVSGTSDDVRMEGWVSGDQFMIPDVLGGVNMQAVLQTPRAGRLGLTLDFSADGRGLGSIAGDFPISLGMHGAGTSLGGMAWLEPRDSMQATAVVHPVTVREINRRFPALSSLPQGRLSSELRLGGTPLEPSMEWKSGWDVRLGEENERARVDMDFNLDDGLVSVDGRVHQGGAQRLRLEGEIESYLEPRLAAFWAGETLPGFENLDAWVGALDVEIVPVSLPLGSLSPLVEFPEAVRGKLGGGLQVGGTASLPTVAGALQIVDGVVGGVPMSPALVAVSPGDKAYKLMGLFGLGEGSFELAGSLPHDFESTELSGSFLDQQGLSVNIWGRGVPLGVLSVIDPAIGATTGLVSVKGHIGGSLREPSPELEMLLEEGSIEYPPLGLAIRDLVLQAGTEDAQLVIRRAAGRTEPLVGRTGRRPGRFEAQGTVPMWGEDTSMAVSVQLEETLLSGLSDLEVVLSGGMLVKGQWPELVFEGSIEVDEAHVAVDEDFWLSQATLSLDPDLLIHREESEVELERMEKPRAYWEYFVANLGVDLGNNSWGEARVPLDTTYGAVSSALSTVAVQGRVRGTVELKGSLANALVKGQLETERAKAEVFGTEFEVQRGGLVRFIGDDYQNPELDLVAVHQTNGYGDVTVDISGTVEALSLQFRSSEGLSEKDIAALLLLGRPTSELGEGEGGLVEAAVGALAGRAESIGLGDWVDLFQLETEGDSISAYTVGKAVGDKAFLSYSQDLDDDESELTLEVFFTRHVQAQVVTEDSGASSVDVFLRWRF